MSRRLIPAARSVALLALSFAAVACSTKTAAPSYVLKKATASADYALTTCVVTGEELGPVADRIAYTCDGTEVQFCCPDCVGDFQKDPAKYLATIRAAKK